MDNINNELINNAFVCAEFLRDFCQLHDNCYGCPFCVLCDDHINNYCALGTIYHDPCDWDLVKCRL